MYKTLYICIVSCIRLLDVTYNNKGVCDAGILIWVPKKINDINSKERNKSKCFF